MKFVTLALAALFSLSTLATEVNQDFGITYQGFIGSDGTYKTEFQFSVPGNPDLQYLFTNFFYNEEFQAKIDKRVKQVKFEDLGNGDVHAVNTLCAVGFCKDIHSDCSTDDQGDVLGRSCNVNFTKGDAADVLSADGRFGSLNEVYCDNKGGEVSCSFIVSGKTKSIVINSALKVAKETISSAYKNIASVLVGLQDSNATFPLTIKNTELSKLNQTLDSSTDKEFSN